MMKTTRLGRAGISWTVKLVNDCWKRFNNLKKLDVCTDHWAETSSDQSFCSSWYLALVESCNSIVRAQSSPPKCPIHLHHNCHQRLQNNQHLYRADPPLMCLIMALQTTCFQTRDRCYHGQQDHRHTWPNIAEVLLHQLAMNCQRLWVICSEALSLIHMAV